MTFLNKLGEIFQNFNNTSNPVSGIWLLNSKKKQGFIDFCKKYEFQLKYNSHYQSTELWQNFTEGNTSKVADNNQDVFETLRFDQGKAAFSIRIGVDSRTNLRHKGAFLNFSA